MGMQNRAEKTESKFWCSVCHAAIGEPFFQRSVRTIIFVVLTPVVQQTDNVIHQAPVVQKVDNAIHRINLYPLNGAIGFPNTHPLDSDLSGEWRYPSFEQPGPDKLYPV